MKKSTMMKILFTLFIMKHFAQINIFIDFIIFLLLFFVLHILSFGFLWIFWCKRKHRLSCEDDSSSVSNEKKWLYASFLSRICLSLFYFCSVFFFLKMSAFNFFIFFNDFINHFSSPPAVFIINSFFPHRLTYLLALIVYFGFLFLF